MAFQSHPDPSFSPGALVERAKGLGTGLAKEVQRTSRYNKMRAAVVGAWAILTVATVWGACPSSGPTNSLGAEVQAVSNALMGGLQVFVRNESSDFWTDVVLTLDENWKYEQKTVRPHSEMVVSISQFRGKDPVPHDYHPKTLEIRCREGRFATSFTASTEVR